MSFDVSFDGATFDPTEDGERLSRQLLAVRSLMLDGRWRTFVQIQEGIGMGTEAAISARLRDLRKPRFGAYEVLRRRVPGTKGLHEYRVVPPALLPGEPCRLDASEVLQRLRTKKVASGRV